MIDPEAVRFHEVYQNEHVNVNKNTSEEAHNIFINLPDSKYGKQGVIKFNLTKSDVDRMTDLLRTSGSIVCYTDGASSENPGKSGAGVCFTSVGGGGKAIVSSEEMVTTVPVPARTKINRGL